MAKKEKMVVGVFRNRLDAESAFDGLLAMGYTNSEIAMLMTDQTRATYYKDVEHEGKHKAGTMATEGMGVGGAIGTVTGAIAGIAAVVAAGTALTIPGLNLIVVGPIAAALMGAGAGAVTGGLIGTLVGAGIPEQNAQAYEEALREGGIVLGVVPHQDDTSRIKDLFNDHNGENVCYC
jgi:hypothetical protein